ncbi:MAG: TerD family protein, partial [Bacteroidota bacterium]
MAEAEVMIEVRWESRGETCDVDLGCVLLDAQGRVLEIIDFNNPMSNDRSVRHGGDAVDCKEQLYVGMKNTAAVTVMLFNKTFAKLASLEMTIGHLKCSLEPDPSANLAVLCAIANGEIECVMSQAVARTRGELMHATQQGLGRLYP